MHIFLDCTIFFEHLLSFFLCIPYCWECLSFHPCNFVFAGLTLLGCVWVQFLGREPSTTLNPEAVARAQQVHTHSESETYCTLKQRQVHTHSERETYAYTEIDTCMNTQSMRDTHLVSEYALESNHRFYTPKDYKTA